MWSWSGTELLFFYFSFGLFPSHLLIKTLYAFLISPMNATCPTHLIFLDLVPLIIFSEMLQIVKFLVVQIFPAFLYFYSLGQNNLLSTFILKHILTLNPHQVWRCNYLILYSFCHVFGHYNFLLLGQIKSEEIKCSWHWIVCNSHIISGIYSPLAFRVLRCDRKANAQQD